LGDLVDAHNVGVGTFRDVQALIDGGTTTRRGHFTHTRRLRDHRHLVELGINALELLPPADTFADRRSWGYATSNYFAPDFDLGRPLDPAEPPAANDAKASTAVGDLLALVRSCHGNGIRFFYDAVMAITIPIASPTSRIFTSSSPIQRTARSIIWIQSRTGVTGSAAIYGSTPSRSARTIP
jgi:hypothetical protein